MFKQLISYAYVRNCFIVATLALAALLSFQSAYASQDAESVADANIVEVTPFEAINYYLARHFNTYSVAVTGFLSPETQLPAKVEIAVPAGSEIFWFSEMSGGFIGNDPEFTEPFNVRTEAGLDIYTVVLEHYSAVQIEYRIEGNPNQRISEGIYSIAMEYTPLVDTPFVRLMTNLPAESAVEDPSAVFMGADDEGYLVFMRLYENASALQPVQGEITYWPPAGTGMIDESNNLLGGLGAAIGAVVAVIAMASAFVYFSRRRRTQEI